MQSSTPWLDCRNANPPRGEIDLFCFPHAGAGEWVFRSWQSKLPSFVTVRPIRLPGRGARSAESPRTDLKLLVDELSLALVRSIENPFAFFGNSMGALIAFETAFTLSNRYGSRPVHLFLSARCSPGNVVDFLNPEAPKDELVDRLKLLNGTSPEVLANTELFDLLVPVLRADLALCRSHDSSVHRAVDCAITAFAGAADPTTTPSCLRSWQSHTSRSFALKVFSGDHFFVGSAESLVLEAIATDLQRYRR